MEWFLYKGEHWLSNVYSSCSHHKPNFKVGYPDYFMFLQKSSKIYHKYILKIYQYFFDTLRSVMNTAQKTKFSTKDFFGKCDQIRKKLGIWSYLLKKLLMENFIFCAVEKPSVQGKE